MIFPPIDDICDCHSHVFGPFARFPLSPKRTFDPPEAAIEQLSDVWKSLGIQRAVLVQGSAHGSDHGALLEAILQSPQTRRGVALLDSSVTDEAIAGLHRGGIRENCIPKFRPISCPNRERRRVKV